jgi:signal transduction histidine kinase
MKGQHTLMRPGAGRGPGAWPVLLILLAAVLVPSGCVLWFMHAAMRNERLAVRERLKQAYRARLLEAQQAVDAYWDRRAEELSMLPGERPGEAFARLARSGRADSFLVLDEQGRVAYPNPDLAVPEAAATPPTFATARTPGDGAAQLLAEAERAEFALAAPESAADIYTRAAERATDDGLAARAVLGRARCLLKAERHEDALPLLLEQLQEPRFARARDAQGRLIGAAARLLALEAMVPTDARFQPAAERLGDQVNDYADLSMPAGQRVFLMTRLLELADDVSCPTLPAELAWHQLAQGLTRFDAPPTAARLVSAYNGPSGSDEPRAVEHLHAALLSADRRVYGLFRGRRVIEETESLLNRGPGAVEATFRVVSSVVPRPALGTPFLAMGASRRHMTDWRVRLYLNGPDPFAQAARRRNIVYLWTGGVGIVLIVALATATASYLGRQIRLTRLKNDLIATVSHELKTPLASMRVLVDTLREGRCAHARQPAEYLDLIARENERLSRLIDNFLTFSRMERNKRAFDFAVMDVRGAVDAAVAAVRDRFASPDARLDVELPDQPMPVRADRDALVTVLLNLLDNAWKYSDDRKAVRVRAVAADGDVRIEISDNGVGLSRRAQRRIFDRFYQVDRTLSRKAGGCGLGLSIVKFIVDAHGGTVHVRSRPGEGSTFTVSLPAADVPLAEQASM